jgi:hypothetical protein
LSGVGKPLMRAVSNASGLPPNWELTGAAAISTGDDCTPWTTLTGKSGM